MPPRSLVASDAGDGLGWCRIDLRGITLWLAGLLIMILSEPTGVVAQIRIAHIQPDAVAPGMTIALEVMAYASDSGALGGDGLAVSGTRLEFANASDSTRVIVGPLVTSWSGRVVQVPMIVSRSASVGALVFRLRVGSKVTEFQTLSIVRPSPPISIVNGAVLGSGSFTGALTSGNTMVVDSMTLAGDLGSGATYSFPQVDTNLAGPGNLRYLPITILSAGSVRIKGAHLSLDADSLLNGGPGGGGGGHGSAGFGGAGFTGGGSDSTGGSSNVGTGSAPTDSTAGGSITGVLGGGNDNQDQGGGGGTGAPYGTSGSNGVAANPSPLGGYGGGSAGGEFSSDTTYGGGGGGFGTAGGNGKGQGANGGHVNGGRFLVPLAGGSGGGAGNAFNEARTAGSGGGGGGAISIVSFGTIDLQNSYLSAKGGNGTSGTGLTAGGGGGSGGAFLFAARKGFLESSLTLSTDGGAHGRAGGANGTDGGDGGLGRVRVDGAASGCLTCFHSGIGVYGPSLSTSDTVVTVRQITVAGFDEDTSALTDSVRVYYRTGHTPWRHVDTVRFARSGHHVWQKTLPTLHDSLVYIAAFAQVNLPSRTLADQEPDWLVSHISVGTIRELPSAFLSPSEDSIDFSCVKIGGCLTHRLGLRDLGEASATIDSIVFDDPLDFSSDAQVPLQVAPYVTDSITVNFCPIRAGSFFTRMHIYSNDSVRTLALLGCGLSINDSITLSPPTLDFGRRRPGTCDTLTTTIVAAGTDTSRVHLGALFAPPFQALTTLDSIALPPGRSVQLKVEFCPLDTGRFVQSARVDGDTLRVIGSSVRAMLSLTDTLHLPDICLGNCTGGSIQLYNLGNDTGAVTAITVFDSTIAFSPDLPIRCLPNDSVQIHWSRCGGAAGHYAVPISLSSIDTTLRFMIEGNIESITLPVHPIDFGTRCLDADTSLDVRVVNGSVDSLTIIGADLTRSSVFTLGSPFRQITLGLGDSTSIQLRYHTSVAGLYLDTLRLAVQNGGCDSVVLLALRARSSQEPIVLSDSVLDFGVTRVDSCLRDSVIIANPCGASLFIAPPSLRKPFVLVEPLDSFELGSGTARALIFDYCPTSEGRDTLPIQIADTSLHSYRLSLIGTATRPVKAIQASISVSHQVAQLGSTSTVTVIMDSLVGASQLDSLRGRLTYDPTVIHPLQATSVQPSLTVSGIESQPGRFELAMNGAIRPGSLVSVSFSPLLGFRDSTPVVFLDSSISPAGVATSHPGYVKLEGCGNLPGHVSVAGAYSLDPIGPNPATASIHVRFMLGTDGPVTLQIRDALGALRLIPLNQGPLAGGTHDLTIPLSGLTSGLHFVVIESLGWRKTEPFIVAK